MLELIIACALSSSFLTIDDISEYKQCKAIEYKVEAVEEHIPLIVKEFGIDEALTPLLIIYCESSGNKNAVNINKNGTSDKGLWQFNDKTWAWLKNKLNIKSSPFNTIVSTKVAKWLMYNDGLHHWNASRKCWDI
jgi:hypothetical protein